MHWASFDHRAILAVGVVSIVRTNPHFFSVFETISVLSTISNVEAISIFWRY